MDREELVIAIEKHERVRDLRRFVEHRLNIFLAHREEVPICILCKYCQHKGFLFHCPLFELPESDPKVVGDFGKVLWHREGKIKKYPNTPMEPHDCKEFEPIVSPIR